MADKGCFPLTAAVCVDCFNAEIEKFPFLCGNATVHCGIRTIVNNEPLGLLQKAFKGFFDSHG